MRCLTCKTTGYTEDELGAHEKKSGHKRPTDGSHATSREYTPTENPVIPRAELIAALKDLGVDPAELAALIPGDAPPKGGR